MDYYWKAKLVKGGVYIPVKTWFGAPLIHGEEIDRSHRWQALVHREDTGRMILYGEPIPIEIEGLNLRNIEGIDEATYRYMIAHAEWASGTDHPEATPTRKIDWMKTKLPF